MSINIRPSSSAFLQKNCRCIQKLISCGACSHNHSIRLEMMCEDDHLLFFKFPPSREEVSLPRLADKQCEKKFFADESLQAIRPEFQDVIFFAKVYDYWSIGLLVE